MVRGFGLRLSLAMRTTVLFFYRVPSVSQACETSVSVAMVPGCPLATAAVPIGQGDKDVPLRFGLTTRC
jgi:hypothetical protein